MKLLVVSPYLPALTGGSRSRSYYLLKMLARKHRVSLLAIVCPDEVEAYAIDASPLTRLTDTVQLLPRIPPQSKRLSQLLNLVSGKSNTLNDHTIRGIQEAVDALLVRDQYDAVFFDCALTAGISLPAHVKKIVCQHNIEFELLWRGYMHEKTLLRRLYNWWEYHLVKPFELECCRRADLVLVTSERERLFLKNLLPRSIVEVVPNGVDLEMFQVAPHEQEVANQVFFSGSLDYYPNVQAVLFFAQECWPLIRQMAPDAHWQIVGRNPPPEILCLNELPGVSVAASVPYMQPYFAKAAVAVVPLLVGSGTRLKILEAFSMEKAVVSTTIGAEGLSVVPGEHLLIEDQPEAFARATVDLLADSKRRSALGRAGRELVDAEYSWDRCGERLLHALDQIS